MANVPNDVNINRLWADLIVDELVRNDINFFCLAPGSRSTPLTTAVAAHPRAQHIMHLDERGTAFCALGYARATGKPAVWITTSGTAVANGLPAVVEASTDGVPMLMITADRPPELRQTGANQTIDQVGIFGGYTRWAFDLPAPGMEVDPAMLLTTVDQAVYRTQRAPSGPVHLNCMFREPLAPDADGQDYTDYLERLASWRQGSQVYTRYAAVSPQVSGEEIGRLWAALRGVRRGLLVAGKLETPAQGDAVRWLADLLGWPLLPDVGSQIRLGGADVTDCGVGYYDLMLSSEHFRALHRPEAVLHVGGRSTSKRLLQFVEQVRPAPYVVVREDPSRLDPTHDVTWRIESDIIHFCNALARAITADPAPEEEARSAWSLSWRHASDAVDGALKSFFKQDDTLSEPVVARCISEHIPEGHGLCLSSSMPVRDMDMFAALDGSFVPVAANRGASGIDGVLATAAGFASGLQAPVTLAIGDLALLHDVNSLALLRDLSVPLVIVAINNHGGGIFSFLPIARHADVFEPFFGTPHEASFEHAAALFGLTYERPGTPEDLSAAYRAACGRGTSTLIEVVTDRDENRALHAALQQTATAALTR